MNNEKSKSVAKLLIDPECDNGGGTIGAETLNEMLNGGILTYNDLKMKCNVRVSFYPNQHNGYEKRVFWDAVDIELIDDDFLERENIENKIISKTPEEANASGVAGEDVEIGRGSFGLSGIAKMPIWAAYAIVKITNHKKNEAFKWLEENKNGIGFNFDLKIADDLEWGGVFGSVKKLMHFNDGKWADIFCSFSNHFNPKELNFKIDNGAFGGYKVIYEDGVIKDMDILEDAINQSNHTLMEKLVSDGWDLNAKNKNGDLMIMRAANYPTLSKMLELGADPLKTSDSGLGIWDVFKKISAPIGERKVMREKISQYISKSANSSGSSSPELNEFFSSLSIGVIGGIQPKLSALIKSYKNKKAEELKNANGYTVGDVAAISIVKSDRPGSFINKMLENIKKLESKGLVAKTDTDEFNDIDKIMLAGMFSMPGIYENKQINGFSDWMQNRWPVVEKNLYDWAVKIHPFGVPGVMNGLFMLSREKSRQTEVKNLVVAGITAGLAKNSYRSDAKSYIGSGACNYDGHAFIRTDAMNISSSYLQTEAYNGKSLYDFFDFNNSITKNLLDQDGKAPWLRNLAEKTLLNGYHWNDDNYECKRISPNWLPKIVEWAKNEINSGDKELLWTKVAAHEALNIFSRFSEKWRYSNSMYQGGWSKFKFSEMNDQEIFQTNINYKSILSAANDVINELGVDTITKNAGDIFMSWGDDFFDKLYSQNDPRLATQNLMVDGVPEKVIEELKRQYPDKTWSVCDKDIPKYVFFRVWADKKSMHLNYQSKTILDSTPLLSSMHMNYELNKSIKNSDEKIEVAPVKKRLM